jgi:hypothetical protein
MRSRVWRPVNWLPISVGDAKSFNTAIVITGVIFVSILAGGLIALGYSSLAVLFVAAFWGLWILAKPEIAVSLFFASAFIPLGYIERHFSTFPILLLWLPHLLLVFGVVSSLLATKQPFRVLLPPKIAWVGMAWIAITLISLVVNGSSFIAALLSLRRLFLLYGSIVLFRLHSRSSEKETWLKTLVWIGLFQIPIAIFQRFVLVEYLSLNTGDLVSGVFKDYSGLVFFQIFCILSVISWWLHGKRLLPLSPAVTITLLFIPIAISNSKAAPLYFFVALIFLLWLCRSRISPRLLAAILVLFIVGSAGTLILDQFWRSDYNQSESFIEAWYAPERMFYYLFYQTGTSSGGLQRGGAILFNFNLIREELLTLILGLGPGALSDSRMPGGTGYIYVRYPNLALNNNSLATIIGELGILGILLLFGLVLGFYTLRNFGDSSDQVVLRKSTVFFLISMLIYKQMLLLPVVGVVLGIVSMESKLRRKIV